MKEICVMHETFRVKKQVYGPLVIGPNHFLATLLSLSQTLLNSLEPLQGWYLVLVTPLPSLHVPSAVSRHRRTQHSFCWMTSCLPPVCTSCDCQMDFTIGEIPLSSIFQSSKLSPKLRKVPVARVSSDLSEFETSTERLETIWDCHLRLNFQRVWNSVHSIAFWVWITSQMPRDRARHFNWVWNTLTTKKCIFATKVCLSIGDINCDDRLWSGRLHLTYRTVELRVARSKKI